MHLKINRKKSCLRKQNNKFKIHVKSIYYILD